MSAGKQVQHVWAMTRWSTAPNQDISLFGTTRCLQSYQKARTSLSVSAKKDRVRVWLWETNLDPTLEEEDANPDSRVHIPTTHTRAVVSKISIGNSAAHSF